MYEVIETGLLRGDAWLIKVDGDYFMVSRADTLDYGDETMIFTANEHGEVTDWVDLYVGHVMDHDTAITNWLSER